MVISEYKYQIGESIDNYLQSGINYKTIHQRYYKDMSYKTVLEYHRQYKMINELLLECQKNSDFLYNVDLPIPGYPKIIIKFNLLKLLFICYNRISNHRYNSIFNSF